MIEFKLRDTTTDEEYEFKSDSRHVVVWERTSRTNETFVSLLAEMNMVALYRLAHITARQMGLPVPKEIKEFEADWTLTFADEAPAVPTEGAVISET